MRVLIAGYGNIGRAVEALINKVQPAVVSKITICDRHLQGLTVQQWLANWHETVDVVVNVTGAPLGSIFALCQRYHLDYIDTGMELGSGEYRTLGEAFRDFRKVKSDIRALIGFGMNPGLIEYIYYLSALKRKHVAIELEYDTASWVGGDLFNTWRPESFCQEATVEQPFWVRRGQLQLLPPPGLKLEVGLTVDGVERTFHLIPHEEIAVMSSSQEHCQLCAFLYQAPLAMERFLKINWGRMDAQALKKIPTPGDGLVGHDNIGMLISDEGKKLVYYYNRGDHAACSNYYHDREGRGINATSWQVACGVYVALKILPLLPPRVYCMTDLAAKYSDYIERGLSELNFELKRREFDPQGLQWPNLLKIIGDGEP